ncbi:MAG: hypothetical protein IPM29_07020 [Planctomycetes bacterium]|nr:hypothetical protein [Planctomycetota bacterium]
MFRIEITAIAAGALVAATMAQDLAAPVRLTAAGEPITVDVGHAAPYLYDWDGDGDRDLLVGQFGSGKLRIYPNEGTDTEPRYGAFAWFEAGGQVATVPAG